MKRKLLKTMLMTFAVAACAAGFAACTPQQNDDAELSWGDVYTISAAYTQAKELGYTGSLEEFIAAISGKDGADGKDGEDGKDGVGIADMKIEDGRLYVTLSDGKKLDCGAVTSGSASGEDGKDGEDGLSAYEIYKKYHPEYTGTEQEWIESLKGADGEKGDKGEDGKDGVGIAQIYLNGAGELVIVGTDGSILFQQKLPEGGSSVTPDTQQFTYEISADGKSYTITGIGSILSTDIVIPSTYNGLPVTAIGDFVFADCRTIKSMTMPDSLTSIGSGAFSGCASLESITIPDSVTEIGQYAFSDCTALTSIIIPDSVTETGHYAFSGCTLLESIIIPDGVTSISGGAFYDCTSLESINIPDSITSIGSAAFDGCYSLKYNKYDNALYLGNENNPYVALIKAVNEDITDCQINNETKVIGGGAFSGCTSLTSITIPDGVTEIGGGVFGYCRSLTSITIPDSVTSIGSGAFSGCASLESITIPDGVTSIRNYAFYGCTSLESITIPDSVTSIGDEAFSYCTSLKTVYYAGSEQDWEKIVGIAGVNIILENAEIIFNYRG